MSEPSGVLPVDKPRGPTSHDVVARVRRALGLRRVGHAGTLDPMATGLLLVLVGEATKLEPYLASNAKRYRAELTLGRATDTLDAEGTTLEEAPLDAELAAELDRAAVTPADLGPRLRAALDAERARREQIPPAFSAIKVAGRKSYDLARAGRAPELAARPITVRALSLIAVRPPALELEVEASKGYYVRSLARDLATGLGALGHLSALRRVASGDFSVDEALSLDGLGPGTALVPPRDALARAGVPALALGADEALAVRQGKRLPAPIGVESPTLACVDPDGRLIAIARVEEGALVVARGFTAP